MKIPDSFGCSAAGCRRKIPNSHHSQMKVFKLHNFDYMCLGVKKCHDMRVSLKSCQVLHVQLKGPGFLPCTKMNHRLNSFRAAKKPWSSLRHFARSEFDADYDLMVPVSDVDVCWCLDDSCLNCPQLWIKDDKVIEVPPDMIGHTYCRTLPDKNSSPKSCIICRRYSIHSGNASAAWCVNQSTIEGGHQKRTRPQLCQQILGPASGSKKARGLL